MNILYISHSSLATGSESVLISTINGIEKKDIDNQYLVIPYSKTNNFSKQITKGRILKQYILPFKSIGNKTVKSICCLIYNLYSILFICSIVKKKNISLVYVNTSANIAGAVAAWISGRKVVWHIHEQPNRNTSVIPSSFQFLYRAMFLNNRFKMVFTSRKALAGWEEELNCEIENYTIINPPTKEIVGYTKHQADIFTYGYIGTLVESKNLITLIECFEKIVRYSEKKTRLLIFGSGPLLSEIQETVKQLDISQYVEIKDFNSDVSSFYSSIDVLVQPSYNESWGMVIIEAISLQIPAIITKESGVADILTDNTECLLIDPCSKTELFEKMKLILEDQPLRESIGRNAYRKYKEMNLTNSFKNSVYKIIYDK